MIKYLPHLVVLFFIFNWIGCATAAVIQILQAWHVKGEMAAIDELQVVLIMGTPLTGGMIALGAFAFYYVKDELEDW